MKIIIYQYGSVRSDAEMIHSALFNFYCESNCILFLECFVGCGNFFFANPPWGPGVTRIGPWHPLGCRKRRLNGATCFLECCVGCGNGPLRKIKFFYVKIIIYQFGIVRSDAEMVSSAKCIFLM